MKQSRVNLFRNLRKEKQTSTSKIRVPRLKQIQVDGALIYAAAIITAFITMIGMSHRRHQREIADFNARTEATMKNIETVKAEVETVRQKKEDAKKRRELMPEVVLPQTQPDRSPNLDNTWASVLWKLALTTSYPIVIQKMELVPREDHRLVNLSGQADSLVEFQKWLELLQSYLPGSDFIVENQTTAGKAMSFKISAKIL